MFTQAKKIIKEHCIEDHIEEEFIDSALTVIRKISAVNTHHKDDLFLIWDALGLCHDRDNESEALYRLVGMLWWES